MGAGIVHVVTKAHKPWCDSVSIAENVMFFARQVAVPLGRQVTFFVTFGVRSEPPYLRQTVGRYLPSSVLGLHVQSMLPPALIGDRIRLLVRIARLAADCW